jgi:hypothetical protein
MSALNSSHRFSQDRSSKNLEMTGDTISILTFSQITLQEVTRNISINGDISTYMKLMLSSWIQDGANLLDLTLILEIKLRRLRERNLCVGEDTSSISKQKENSQRWKCREILLWLDSMLLKVDLKTGRKSTMSRIDQRVLILSSAIAVRKTWLSYQNSELILRAKMTSKWCRVVQSSWKKFCQSKVLCLATLPNVRARFTTTSKS